jgi:outer membrane receptor protein involved in Fe transport
MAFKIKTKICTTILLLLNALSVFSQNNASVMKGLVFDDNNKPLPFANIAIEGTSIGTFTNEDGTYKIVNIKPGTYYLTASLVGYKTVRKQVSVKNKTHIIDFILTATNYRMNEVNVVAESEASQIKKKGFEMESIDAKGLQSQSIELNQMLGQISGVRVRQTGGLGSRARYSINGLGGKSVRFFMDGVPMDYFGSSFSLATIPVSLVQRIDVYKGVVPVELANDALGGAINLVTRQDFRNMAEVSYSYGSFNTHRASLYGNWKDAKTGLTIKALAFYNYSDNNYKVWGDDIYVTDPQTYEIKRGITAERFHDAFDSKAIKTEVGFTDKKWADQFFVGVLLSGMDKEVQHGATMEVPYGEATYEQQVAMPFINYQKKDLGLKNLNANIFAAYSQLERSRVDTSKNIYDWYGHIVGQRTIGGEQQRTLNTLNEDVFSSRINLTYQVSPQHKVGFNHLYSALERNESDPLVTQKTDGYWASQYFNKNSLALAWQSQWMDEKLNTSIFIKQFEFDADIKVATTVAGETTYETVHTSENSIGYGMAGSYWIGERFMLAASFEKSVRLPEANEVLGDGLNVIPTVDLQSENSNNANLGFSWQLLHKDNHQLKWTANGFYRYVTKLIQQVQNGFEGFEYINFDEVSMKGVDTNLEYDFQNKFKVNQSLSFLEPIIETETDELGNENIVQGSRLPNTPFFTANTHARYNLSELFNNRANAFVYWNLSYVAAFYRHAEIIGRENKDKIPKQLVNNFGAGYTFPKEKLTLGIDFNNVFNEQVFDNYAVQKSGRSLFVKLTYRIM